MRGFVCLRYVLSRKVGAMCVMHCRLELTDSLLDSISTRPIGHRSDRHKPLLHVAMRIASNIVGVLCLLVGCIWFLQGINVLPGSFMTGQTKWAVYGAVLFIVGVGVLVVANRRRA